MKKERQGFQSTATKSAHLDRMRGNKKKKKKTNQEADWKRTTIHSTAIIKDDCCLYATQLQQNGPRSELKIIDAAEENCIFFPALIPSRGYSRWTHVKRRASLTLVHTVLDVPLLLLLLSLSNR
jgi:hypothetical protein